jgi:filamentous hemagglutinin
VAGRDLLSTAGTVRIGGDGAVVAGRDIALRATGTTVTTRGANDDRSERTAHAVSTIQAGGNLALAAGRDLQSQGAELKAGGQLAASAGRDLSLQAVTDVDSHLAHTHEGRTQVTTATRDERLRGTSLSGGEGVVLSAGRDVVATAAAVDGGSGAVSVAAGHDVRLAAGAEQHDVSRDTQRHRHGLLSSVDTTTHDDLAPHPRWLALLPDRLARHWDKARRAPFRLDQSVASQQ